MSQRFESLDSNSIYQLLVRSMRTIKENSAQALQPDVLIYRVKPEDIVVNSEAEMLSGIRNHGDRIIRSDTSEIYYFQGGDVRDRANYLLLGTWLESILIADQQN